jgi:hypothetical protein
MNTEKATVESTPPTITSFSSARNGAEMIADGLAVDDRSKCAAEVAYMMTFIALFENEVVAR